MSHTLATVLDWHGVTVADETVAELEVPVLDGTQRQGDVLIVPRGPFSAVERDASVLVPREGVAVVRGEATGNTHLLHAEGEVRWLAVGEGVVLGVVEVASGACAYLIHTDEHGANGLAPGAYVLHGKREQADEIRRVAD